jgi:hypothetical protein
VKFLVQGLIDGPEISDALGLIDPRHSARGHYCKCNFVYALTLR